MKKHLTATFLKVCILLAVFDASIWASAQVWAGQAYAPSTQCRPRRYDPSETTYRSWISDYTAIRPKRGANDRNQIQLAITVIDGDDLEPDGDTLSIFGNASCKMTTTTSVSEDGQVAMLRATPLAIQGSGPGPLAEEDFKTVRSLIANLRERLPDDHSQLPPPGRRIVVQVRNGRKMLARVYDRANIPDRIQEILGFLEVTHGPLAMSFAPSKIEKPEDVTEQSIPPDTIGIRRPHPRDQVTKGLRPDTLTLAISPDRSLIVERYLFSPYDGTTVVTDTKTSTDVYGESATLVKGRSVYVTYAWFTPDGRFLLLLNNLPETHIYNTNTWQEVKLKSVLPTDAIAYYPSADWKHGVALSASHEVSLWDATVGHKLSTLDIDGALQSVSFSPPGSLVAVTSVRQNKDQSSTFHFRIWETKTGQFTHELRPLYFVEHDLMGDPIWWGDGKYVLAEAKEGRFGGYVVAVWNAESGYLRGGFSGCSGLSDDPFDVGLAGVELFKLCRDGTLFRWNVSTALDEVGKFEKSLNQDVSVVSTVQSPRP